MSGFQVMPPLTADERAELESSILENGVQVPILVAADGTIVDGHHRDEIARKHNLHCPRTISDKGEQELRGLAFSLNLHRRHLSREQKRQIVAESIKADPQLSDREHGRRTGVSKNTAAAVRDELTESGQIDHFAERIDPRTGNASQPATKPRREVIFTDEVGEEIGRAVEYDDMLVDEEREQWETDQRNAIECSSCAQDFDSSVITEVDPENLLCPQCLDTFDDVAPEPEPAEPERKARRRPLEEGFFDATMRLKKSVTSLENLGKDDRLPRNKEKVARYRNDLLQAIDALQRVADQLT